MLFRSAFVQERAAQARAGKAVGKTVLFFGCRKKEEDFLYENEWDVSKIYAVLVVYHHTN